MKLKRLLIVLLAVLSSVMAILSLTACGKVDFAVKFSVDGVEYATVSTGGSEVIKMPTDPQKYGYTFDGWFWDDGVWARPFTANSLLNEPLKSDMTVYAKFSVNHSHNFNKQVATEPYLKSAATCTARTIYYYSCECGMASEAETFEYGELKDHTFNGTHTCAVCGYYSDAIMYTEISSKNLIVNGNEIKGKVANAQTTFSFINDIEVADSANYTVYSDLACVHPVPSKTISLIDGDNVCYILVTNGNDINLYTVTVRRRHIYTVAFDTSGGTEIKSQQVEEDSLAIKPAAPNRIGYAFSSFDYDFNKPILENTTINAKWEAVKYKITYELNGGVNDTDNPTTYTIEDKIELKPAVSNKLGYSFASWDNGGKIEKGSTGDKTFTANYTTDVKLSSDGTTVTGLNNAVSDLVILSEYDGVKVTSIANKAFSNCASLESIIIPDSVTIIGYSAFEYCGKLTSITIPDSVTSIGYDAFSDCTSLTSVIISNCVTSVSLGMFIGCSSLTSITIPDSVTKIEDAAFRNCTSLENVTIGKNVTFIGGYKHMSGVGSIEPSSAFKNTSVRKINYSGDVNNWVQIDGLYFLMSYGCSDKELYLNNKLLTEAVIDTVAKINDDAFYHCTSLESVTIGNRVTSIGSYAFCNCNSLTSITIPDSVTRIGESVFRDCTSLESITLPFIGASKTVRNGYDQVFGYIFGYTKRTTSYVDGAICQYAYNREYYHYYIPASLKTVILSDSVNSIFRNAFYGCTSLTSVTIVNGVTNIGDSAFWGCSSLTSINIPEKVTSIGDNAFTGTSFTMVEYCGTKAQWDNIIKDSNWRQYSKITSIKCSDGTITIE